MVSRDEGRGRRRVGGWPEKGGGVPGGLDDVFAGKYGPFSNEFGEIQPHDSALKDCWFRQEKRAVPSRPIMTKPL